MQSKFYNIKNELEKKLSNNAFRRGTSAFRFGLIPQGISDHLPITVRVNRSDRNLQLLSWNLLADVHLYNNFMNVSGISHLAGLLRQRQSQTIYFNDTENRLFYFFAELAQYLYKNTTPIEITEHSLKAFISPHNQSSHLARSRDPELAATKAAAVAAARAELVAIFIEQLALDQAHHHEFELMIKHSVELIYHIQDAEGALQWKNRYKLIRDNAALVEKIIKNDFICLQECSKPETFLEILRAQSKDTLYQLIAHRIDDHTTDHCALLYDQKQFTLLDQPVKGALEGKKPYIFAKFQDRTSGEIFIVASIHHPGGSQDLRHELLEQVATLQGSQKSMPFYMLGDFNHAPENFQHAHYNMIYPEQGTSAGSDYGNTNKAIDGMLTNIEKTSITASVVDAMPVSPPASPLPMGIRFFNRAGKTNNDEMKLPQANTLTAKAISMTSLSS